MRLILDRDARICVPGLLRGDALGLAQAAQLRAEQHAQDGRLGRDVIRVGAQLRADRHASFHHRSDVDRPNRSATAAGQAECVAP